MHLESILFFFSICACSQTLRLAYDTEQMGEIEKIFGVQQITDSEKRERLLRFLQQPLTEVQRKKLLDVWKYADMTNSGRGKRDTQDNAKNAKDIEAETIGDVFEAIWKELYEPKREEDQ